jgi:hypothetical protein
MKDKMKKILALAGVIELFMMRSYGVAQEGNLQLCPSGQSYCGVCAQCLSPDTPCNPNSCSVPPAPVHLSGEAGTVYLLPSGTSVICNSGKLMKYSSSEQTDESSDRWFCPALADSPKKK